MKHLLDFFIADNNIRASLFKRSVIKPGSFELLELVIVFHPSDHPFVAFWLTISLF